MSDRQRIPSGSKFESTIGFSRAIRVGRNVYVSGTAPIWPNGSCDPDPEIQAQRGRGFILEPLPGPGPGGRPVVRRRRFITDPEQPAGVGRAHRAVFAGTGPAA